MFLDSDPLDTWLFLGPQLESSDRSAQMIAEVRETLDDLARALEHPSGSKPDLAGVLPFMSGAPLVTLSPPERERAQELALRLAQYGTKAAAQAEEFLLNVIGYSRAPEAVSFWQGVLDLKRGRGKFAERRRRFALAALAFLAIRDDHPAAYAALDAALRHPDAQARAYAAYYLGSAYGTAERPLPEATLAALHAVATADAAFEPRYEARATLRYLGYPVPLDNPGGVYVFKVKLRGDRSGATRTLALRSEQTLEDLHFAIQEAFEWDADHLYSFYLRGKAYDEEYEISGPEGDPIFGALYEEVMQALEDEEAEDEDVDTAPDDESEAAEDDEGLDATSAVIGSLGLPRGHTMLYLFDFGDGHEFDVTLAEIQPRAEPGDYPRLLAAEGEAPPQYPSDEEWDDGEEWDGDEEWDEDE